MIKRIDISLIYTHLQTAHVVQKLNEVIDALNLEMAIMDDKSQIERTQIAQDKRYRAEG